MKKVYVLITDVLVDFEEVDKDATVFGSVENAKKAFASKVEESREWDSKSDFVVECDTDTEYLAYKDGYYCESHTHIRLVERNIE